MAHESGIEVVLPEPPPGSIADLFRQILPQIEFQAGQTAAEVALTVQRKDFSLVMRTARGHEALQFDFLRCLSGVDLLTGLEVVYHLYSYNLGHSVAIKVRCHHDDAVVPTVSHLWQTANWHERECREMFGVVFEGHPDLRPLLLEESVNYYPLLKTHPLAEIEDWQESILDRIEAEQAKAVAEAMAAGAAVDEKALKVALAQKKAEIIKQVRAEAQEKGWTREEEQKVRQERLQDLEAQFLGAPAAASQATINGDDRAAKVALAQKKAEVIKRAREEAKTRGLSGDKEKAYVQDALKALAEQEKAG